MSLVLVVESESGVAQRIRDGLAADGWLVEIAGTRDAALAAAKAHPPQVALINSAMPGGLELIRQFAHAAGGPGVIALLPAGGAPPPAEDSHGTLTKPFGDADLRKLVRRVAAARPAIDTAAGQRLTSKDLFSDVLAEVEEAAPPPRSAPASGLGDVERKLEQTLSGVFGAERRAAVPPAAKKPAGGGVDEMLSRTLSGLDVGKKPAPPKPVIPPAAVAPKPAPHPRPEPPRATVPVMPPPAPAPPAPVTPPAPAAPPPPSPPVVSAAATQQVPVPTPKVALPPPEAAPPPPAKPRPAEARGPDSGAGKRASREIDLSMLDQLAKPKAREATPSPGAKPAAASETARTQKIEIPGITAPRNAPAEFGQYTLLERIAVGGMAEVWKARMKGVEGFQKTVAIKRILPHLTDSSDFLTMFIDEAKLAAQLNHNNIIHIYDLGKLGDDYFIAMEFVDGRDLRTILNTARQNGQPLPLGLALLVGSGLASALDYAHRKKDFEGRELGLVHRDVSPQNVLISFEGDIKLCDFGIVKAVTKASKTQMGALKGKLQYMSPEQAWGRPVDARSDLFSLGSLLFEMLTARRLFAGESEMSVLDAVREGRVQAPRDLDPRLPLEVNALVLKALARDPGDRFQTAGEMQREIDAILQSMKPNPGKADLAGYMKRLFGIEGRAEITGAAAAAPAFAAPAAPVKAAVPAAAAPVERSVPASSPAVATVAPAPGTRVEAAESEGGKGQGMLWGLIAAAVVLGVVAYLFLGRGAAKPPETPPVAAPTDTAAPANPEATAPVGTGTQPAGGTPATTPAAASPAGVDVAKAVDDEVKRREADLKKKYEDELKKSQAALDKLAKPKEATPTAAATAPPPPEAVPAPPVATAATQPAPNPAPAVETAPAPSEPATSQAAAETPRAAEPEPAPPPAPKPPAREGDLVEPGPGVLAPVLVSFNKPQYPPIARRMRVEGTVAISLLVDETGKVVEARIVRGVTQNVGLNEAALSAARSAQFKPATKNGVRVKMWSQLTIPFKLSD
ncbi:MAG: TonB family protein [Thermoanaerobaculia bacterium]